MRKKTSNPYNEFERDPYGMTKERIWTLPKYAQTSQSIFFVGTPSSILNNTRWILFSVPWKDTYKRCKPRCKLCTLCMPKQAPEFQASKRAFAVWKHHSRGGRASSPSSLHSGMNTPPLGESSLSKYVYSNGCGECEHSEKYYIWSCLWKCISRGRIYRFSTITFRDSSVWGTSGSRRYSSGKSRSRYSRCSRSGSIRRSRDRRSCCNTLGWSFYECCSSRKFSDSIDTICDRTPIFPFCWKNNEWIWGTRIEPIIETNACPFIIHRICFYRCNGHIHSIARTSDTYPYRTRIDRRREI